MKIKSGLATITIGIVGILAPSSHAAETTIEQMPAQRETQFAPSALPPALRESAAMSARPTSRAARHAASIGSCDQFPSPLRQHALSCRVADGKSLEEAR
jgi:hypothetical protein